MYYSVSLLLFEWRQIAEGKIHYEKGFVRPDPRSVENSGTCAAEQKGCLFEMFNDRRTEFFRSQP